MVGKTGGVEIDLLPIFANITLLVISSAGFGRRISWIPASESSVPELDFHHLMGFTQAIRSTVHYFFFKLLMPTCAYTLSQKMHIPWLTQALNKTTIAFESLRTHMLEMVTEAPATNLETPRAKARAGNPTLQGTTSPKEIKFALLANLVKENMAYHEDNAMSEKQKTLTDEELLSDTFVRAQTLPSEGI